MRRRRIAILGSTGSVGRRALEVAKHLRGRVQITALAAGKNGRQLLRQARVCKPALLGIADVEQGVWLRAQLLKWRGPRPRLVVGPTALELVAEHRSSDLVLTAVVGAAGLLPTLKAVRAGKDIALANKETLVVGGEIVSAAARQHGVSLLPVDSEHNAIFQCLSAIGKNGHVKRLILTASGGPFRQATLAELKRVTPRKALQHPTWNMGAKITVDSATWMNKGLEVIEAHWLFGVDFDRIAVVVHPQSVIHSMVEAVDGSVLAQLGPTDMRSPIQHAFTYPERVETPVAPLDFSKLGQLTFEAPDLRRFPCLRLALRAGRAGGTLPAALNAANEVAVEAFLKRRLDFLGIPRLLARVLRDNTCLRQGRLQLPDLLETDRWARRRALELIHARR